MFDANTFRETRICRKFLSPLHEQSGFAGAPLAVSMLISVLFFFFFYIDLQCVSQRLMVFVAAADDGRGVEREE